MVCVDATTLWHIDAAEWAPSTASFADIQRVEADVRFRGIADMKRFLAPNDLSRNDPERASGGLAGCEWPYLPADWVRAIRYPPGKMILQGLAV